MGGGRGEINEYLIHSMFCRCLVQIFQDEGQIHQCDQRKCTELRRKSVRNSTQYTCPHVEKVLLDKEAGTIVTK